jgi:EAL domain-containing protein (putative c-di-GMP-specific phosphodiesterase class I)
LKRLVLKYTVPLHLIEIEITESATVENFDLIISLAQAYQEMGFTVAMDDFGTGYSSLNTLRKLPVDVLKLDKGFLHEADTSIKGSRIIQGIIDMSKDIQIKTVCEGIENQGQLDLLTQMGCDIIQGNFLCEPIPYAEYEARYLRP